MSTIDVGMRLGDAIDPFHLANGFEAVIGYECQERSNHPFSHSYDAYNTCKVLQSKCVGGGGSLSGTLLRVTGTLPSLVLRAEDMWQRHNVSK